MHWTRRSWLAAIGLVGCFATPPEVVESATETSGAGTTGSATNVATSDQTSQTGATANTTTDPTTDPTTGNETASGSTTSGGEGDACFIAHLGGVGNVLLVSFRIRPNGTISLNDQREYPGTHAPSSPYAALERSTSQCHDLLFLAPDDDDTLFRFTIPADGTLPEAHDLQLGVPEIEAVWCDEANDLVFAVSEAGDEVTIRSMALDLTQATSVTIPFGYTVLRPRTAWIPQDQTILLTASPVSAEVPGTEIRFVTLAYESDGAITVGTPVPLPVFDQPHRMRYLPDRDAVIVTRVEDGSATDAIVRIDLGNSHTFASATPEFLVGSPWQGYGDIFLLDDGRSVAASTGDQDNQIYLADLNPDVPQAINEELHGADFGFFRQTPQGVLILASQGSIVTLAQPAPNGSFERLDELLISSVLAAAPDASFFQSGAVFPCD